MAPSSALPLPIGSPPRNKTSTATASRQILRPPTPPTPRWIRIRNAIARSSICYKANDVSDIKVVATNRKARHEYFIVDSYEAGIVLTGTEIKSVRASQVSLREGYVQPRDGELWLMGVHIAPYEQAGLWAHDPLRPRKLLMHRREIKRLISIVQEKGYTIVPLRMYLKGKRAKVEIALVRGKRKYDKRAVIAKRDEEREIQRAWKDASRRES
ncbi:MAG: SsrA-binding protein SmpB [Anaerolineae bacterium]|nr:SsrA-binding protein SmpB [Anaerolineae bacterium]